MRTGLPVRVERTRRVVRWAAPSKRKGGGEGAVLILGILKHVAGLENKLLVALLESKSTARTDSAGET